MSWRDVPKVSEALWEPRTQLETLFPIRRSAPPMYSHNGADLLARVMHSLADPNADLLTLD